MNIVIDTNVVISALIKDSFTRRVLIQSGWSFSYPAIAFGEIQEHSGLIRQKAGLDEKELKHLLDRLFVHINIIPTNALLPKIEEAKALLVF